jgi:predicted regulator of Ras-like GTPase activity (Roadblock/LC7/MglB family)
LAAKSQPTYLLGEHCGVYIMNAPVEITKGQLMRRIVEDLIRVEGVIGSLLVGKDGLVVASTLLDEEDAEILGAMSAAVFGEIDKATKRIGVGTLVDSIIDAKDGSILLLEAKELILVVITQRIVNFGLVKMEMRRAAKRISEAVPI